MSLKYIVAEIASELGFHPETVADDRAYLVAKINKAGKELHESRDLVNSNREQLFSLDASTQQCALPHYVFRKRAFRNYYTRRVITMHDMRPRFQTGGWTEPFLTFRAKMKGPLNRELLNFAPVTLSIQQAEPQDFAVTVSGSTINSTRITEVITFVAGETQHTTTNAFTDIAVFANNSPHIQDVTMQDADGNVISLLPNAELQAEYEIIQILDYLAAAPSAPYLVEALYKIRFTPFVNDYDEFCCPGYDDAIIYKTMELLWAKKDLTKASAAALKTIQILNQIAADEESGIEKKIEFGENPTLSQFSRRGRHRYGSLYPGSYP